MRGLERDFTNCVFFARRSGAHEAVTAPGELEPSPPE